MKLSEYFENVKGHGVLATADAEGKVDVAVYSRPHFIDENTIVYIMRDHLTHKNLLSNPSAAYIFIEAGDKHVGKRLYLTRLKEETDPAAIEKIKWRKTYVDPEGGVDTHRYLIYFRIEKVLPLISDKE
jgi:hypothetical protein